MLQTLRYKTSGWFATVVLGVLVVPFAFFGMESYMWQQVDTYAARIAQPPSWWQSAPQAWPLSYLWRTHDIDNADFRQRFEHKGRFSPAMARVPTLANMHPRPGLLGAAAYAVELFGPKTPPHA